MKKLPQLKKSQTIYRGKKVNIALETFSSKEGSFERETIQHLGAVVMIPITSRGQIILIKQYRHTCRKWIWELPAGTRELLRGKVESSRVCASREMQEEVGFKARSLKKLCGFYATPGTSTEYMDIYIAKDLVVSPLPQDEDEMIETKTLSRKRCLEMIQSGVIQDAKTVAALLCYFRFGDRR
jgi:ADP-ribose pyrophosphatase